MPSARAEELNGTEIVVFHKGEQRVGQLQSREKDDGTYAIQLNLSGSEHDRAWFLDVYLDANQVARIEELPALNENDPKWILR